jgi:cytochrome c5
MKSLRILGTALVLSACAAQAAERDAVTTFLGTYCVTCHGPQVHMADRRFDQVHLPAADADTLILLQDIVDKLNLGAMPPKGAKRPSDAEKTAAIAAFTRFVEDGRQRLSSTGGRTVLRRLNRREYLNTIGDLFGLNMSMFDPTTRFPRDQAWNHLDNIGDTLVTSGYLLDQYLDAAEQIVDRALREEHHPQPQTWFFNSGFRQQPEVDYAHREIYGQKFLVLYESANTVSQECAYAPLYAFAEGVPSDGYYEIEVLAEAVNRRHAYDPRLFGIDPDAPFRLGVVPGNAKAGALTHTQPLEPRLGEVTLGDNGPERHKFRVWLDAGYSPRFTFPNGMIDVRRAFTTLARSYKNLRAPDAPDFVGGIRPARPYVLRYQKIPHIRIHEVRITGPLLDEWPRPRYRLFYGDQPFQEDRTRAILTTFATRAYRRPARSEEIDRLMTIVGQRRRDGKSPREAMLDAVKAVLCSPSFLYLSQSEDGPALTPYALASRLSYFLWSTMPDAELMRQAETGALSKPDILLAQARRLLSDHRSQAFVNGFLDSWLNLRALGDMPPDRDAFRDYYAYDLQNAMRTETRMFARHLLDTNRSIADFLDSDYTFVNKPLAALYGIPDVPGVGGEVFRQVHLTDRNRGGLMGQGSVLTVSANGIETSPVTRGVWMLENIFGTPPAPPPDNVPAIDPDVRGAKSMREILTKHRASAACMTCHQKIDPPGFALENFNPIGAWRAKYANGVAIDASGQLDDARFENIAGLKKLLLERKPQFARMLTERVLSYACGRRIEPLDRPRVDRITGELEKRGYGFRDLVELAILSDIFRSK